MATYVKKSCCMGARPSGIVDGNHNMRPDIISKMLKDRHVARFVVAPKGFGKSSIAFEYAQIMYEFKHVIWFKCDSPCFLRDLDGGSLAQLIYQHEPDAQLVVFDDVPYLDSARCELFGEAIDDILSQDCEVIATCVPTADAFSSYQMDKVMLRACDLLLDDDEMSMEILRGNVDRTSSEDISNSERIPGLVWGKNGIAGVIEGLDEEELPSDVELCAFAMLALQRGNCEDLSRLVGSQRAAQNMELLKDDFPYFGINDQCSGFTAAYVDIATLSSSIKCKIGDIVSPLGFQNGDDLFALIGDILINKGFMSRACDLMAAYSTRHGSASWLARNGWHFVMAGLPLAFSRLHESARKEGAGLYDDLSIVNAYALMLLREPQKMRRHGTKVLNSSGSSSSQKAAASFLMARYTPCCDMDAFIAAADEVHALRSSQDACRKALDWGALGRMIGEWSNGTAAFLDALQDCLSSFDPIAGNQASVYAAMLAGSWAIDDLRERASHDSSDADYRMDTATRVVDMLMPMISESSDGGRLTWPERCFVVSAESLSEELPYEVDYIIPPQVVAARRVFDDSLDKQVIRYRAGSRSDEKKRTAFHFTHPDAFREGSGQYQGQQGIEAGTPTLNVSLFGGFNASIDERPIESRKFGRKKAKEVLAILSMNLGHEMTRGRICEILWPDSNSDRSKRNFYAIWSSLKHAIEIDGSCPYLIKTHTGYRLDKRFVKTDVEEFQALCRSLVFGSDEMTAWEDAYGMLTTSFSQDLLPEMSECEYVGEMRDRYRTQLIDGLVSASKSLNARGETRGALWFAREAQRRGSTREDAYIALMQAQIASDQRGAAIDTYFRCRRILRDELGIDPSSKVMSLYHSVIEVVEDI